MAVVPFSNTEASGDSPATEGPRPSPATLMMAAMLQQQSTSPPEPGKPKRKKGAKDGLKIIK